MEPWIQTDGGVRMLRRRLGIVLGLFCLMISLLVAGAPIGTVAEAQTGLAVSIGTSKASYGAGESIPFTAYATMDGDEASFAQISVGAYDAAGSTLWGATYFADAGGSVSGAVSVEALTGFSGDVTLRAEAFDDEESAVGYRTVSYNVVQPPPPPDDDHLAITLSADAGAYRAGAYGELDGQVTFNGFGVAGALVVIAVYDAGGVKLTEVEAVTDANGNYTADLQFPATDGPHYRIRADVGYSGHAASAEVIVDAIADEIEIDVFPPQKAGWGPEAPINAGDVVVLAGHVRRNGVPVVGATVQISLEGRDYFPVPTDGEGLFQHYNLPTDHVGAGAHVLLVEVLEDGEVIGTLEVPLRIGQAPRDMSVALDLGGPYRLGDTAIIAGTLFAGGLPYSDWLEVDIVDPTGTVVTYGPLTDQNGWFSIRHGASVPGTWTVRVFHYWDRTPIPTSGTFVVEQATVIPPPDDDDEDDCGYQDPPEIVDVTFTDPIDLGGTNTVTGLVVSCEGEPLAEEPIKLEAAPYWKNRPNRPGTQTRVEGETDDDGRFTFQVPADALGYVGFNLRTEGYNLVASWDGDYYADRFEVWSEIQVDLPGWGTHDTSTGGSLIVAPFDVSIGDELDPRDDAFAPGFEVLVQLTAPDGQTWTVEAWGPSTAPPDSGAAWRWEVPFGAPSGEYEVVVYVNHSFAEPVEEIGTIEIINLTPSILTVDVIDDNPAMAPGSYDPWWLTRLEGDFIDGIGGTIADATVSFVADSIGDCPPWVTNLNCSPGVPRTFQLPDVKTDLAGVFETGLEELYLFDEGEGTWWEITVTATKENVVTASEIVVVSTFAPPRIEVAAFDPALQHLTTLVRTPEDLAQRVPFNVKLTLRYRTLVPGSVIDVGTGGPWAVDFGGISQVGDRQVCEKATARVSVNGQSPATVDYGEYFEFDPYGDVVFHGSQSPWVPLNKPSMVARMPAQVGFDQQIEVPVSGQLFDFNTPSQPERRDCYVTGWVTSGEVPITALLDTKPEAEVPGYYDGFHSAREEGAFAGAGIIYPFLSDRDFGLLVRGTARVGRATGELDAQVTYEYLPWTPARNLAVQLKPVMFVPNGPGSGDDEYRQTNFIKIAPAGRTDDLGRLEMPITLGEGNDPCHPPGPIYIEVTAAGFDKPGRILVNFDCVPDLTVKIREVVVAQAAQLDDRPVYLAAKKPTSVRVYLELEGAIYDSRGDFAVELAVKMGDQRYTTQIKTVTPGTSGAMVSWDARSPVGGRGGIGKAATWAGSPEERGAGVVPVDFVFTPAVGDLNQSPITIEITADLDGRLGAPDKETIEGSVKKQKRLAIYFVPVDIPGGLSLADVEAMVDFVRQTYPADSVDPRIMAAVSSSDLNDRSGVPGSLSSPPSLGNIMRMAMGIADGLRPVESEDLVLRVVGVVASGSWPQGDDDGAQFFNGVCMIRQTAKLNTLAHEIGHTLGLYVSWSDKWRDWATPDGIFDTSKLPEDWRGSEQYDKDPNGYGFKVNGLITKDGIPVYIPVADPTDVAWKSSFALNGATQNSNIRVYDFMGSPGYDSISGTVGWVIPSTYVHLLHRLADPEPVPILHVTVDLLEEPRLRVVPETGVPVDPQPDGLYSLSLQTSGGTALWSASFGFGIVDPVGAPVAILQIPDDPAAARLVLSHDGEVLATVERSSSPPIVSAIRLGEAGGMLSVSWEAGDVDGDELVYDVELLIGDDRFPLIHGTRETSLTFDPSLLPGDVEAVIAVTAIDGFWSSELTTEPFSISAKAPVAMISLAAPGDDPGTVWVRGTAYDLEDGAVTSDSLVWSSDVDGYLGTGDDLVPTLTPGNHVLTLTATDAHGMTGTAAVAVSIPGTFAEEGGSNLVWGGIGAGGGLVLGLLAAFGLSRIGRRPKVFCPAGHPGTGAAFCTVCGGPVPPAPPEAGGAARTASFAAVAVILAAAGGAVGWIVTPQSSDGAIGIAQIGAVDEAVVAPSADPAQPAMLLTAAALETSGDLLPPGTDTSDPAADPFLIGGIAEATGLGEDGSVMWDVVPADDGGLRGIGYRTFPEGVGATLWESPDGHSWTALDIPALGEGGASILTAAVDAAPIVLGRRVVDGNWQFSSWSRGATGAWALGTADQLTGNGATPMAAAAVDGGFVAVGYVNTTAGLDMAWWHSTDGHHWRSGAPLEPGDQAAFGLAQSGDTVVAVGVHQTDGDQTFAIEDGSEDGAVWVWDGNGFARVLSPAFGTELQELMWDVVATDDGFVAGGRTYTDAADPVDAAVWVSPDGLTWESRPVEPALEGDQSEVIDRLMAAPDGSVVAAGRVGGADLDLGIWHSVDGRTWELVVHQTAPGLQIPRRIRMIGGTAVAAGMSDDGAAVWVIEPG